FYGNSSVTSTQGNASSVWDTDYQGVWHLDESGNPYNDSTANAKNSTAAQTAYPSQATGEIGNGQSFVAGSSTSFKTNRVLPVGGGTFTISGWEKVTGSNYAIFADTRGPVGTNGYGVIFYSKNTNGYLTLESSLNWTSNSGVMKVVTGS